MMVDRKAKAAKVLNILIIAMAVVGTVLMLFFRGNDATLQASGIANLKYFTVLSNEFCGIVAVYSLVRQLRGQEQPMLLKLMAAAAVGLTFLVIAAFLGPLYGLLKMYRRANFFFHLVLPLTAMAEYVLTGVDAAGEVRMIPFRWTLYTMIPVLIYGAFYLGNILINGVGVWPDTNDFYGFVNWGLPVGIGIFAVILTATWGIACALRFVQGKIGDSGSTERIDAASGIRSETENTSKVSVPVGTTVFDAKDLKRCIYRIGGGMLDSNREITLEKDKEGVRTVTLRMREDHSADTVKTVYPAEPEAFKRITEIVVKHDLLGASRCPRSGIELLDGDSSWECFEFEGQHFSIDDDRDMTDEMWAGFRAVREYLESILTGDGVTTVEPDD